MMSDYIWGLLLGIAVFNTTSILFPRTYEINVADVQKAIDLCPPVETLTFNRDVYTVTCSDGVVMTLPAKRN